jgi:hypothetical protein
MTRCSIPTLLLILLCTNAAHSSREDAIVTVSIQTATQDGPVQLVGLRRPEDMGSSPLLHLRNNSTKKSVRISLESYAQSPRGGTNRTNSAGPCGYISSSSDAPNCEFRTERMIPPNGDAWVHEALLQSSSLVTEAMELHSNCLHVAAIVRQVDFEDGTTWRISSEQEGEALAKLGLGKADGCPNITRVETELEQFEGVGYDISGPQRYPDPGVVESYTFSCRFRPLKGKLVAMCPL